LRYCSPPAFCRNGFATNCGCRAVKQRRFDRLMAVLRTANRLLPRFVQQFPFDLMLWDLDRRIRTGRLMV
jgi:uncharacterized protein (DUF2236 family)